METWKPIPGYEGLYLISSLGRIKGIKRGKLLKPVNYQTKYLNVKLCDGRGVGRRFKIHRLVLLSFMGEPLESQTQSRHLNGDRFDNRLDNLRWGTRSENELDKRRHRLLRSAQ